MCGLGWWRVSLVANLNNLHFIVCFGTTREYYDIMQDKGHLTELIY